MSFDALKATQKTQLSAKYHFWKNQEKLAKIAISEKMVIFGSFFLDFSRNGTLQNAEDFCVAFSA